MSVKKYVISKSIGNFTTIPNKVLQELKNYEALGLYCYIASLPDRWEFHKNQLAEHANIGRDKLNKALKVLSNCGLVNIVQNRNEKGQFELFTMEVDDGTNFKINNLESSVQPLTEKPLTENRLLDTSNYKVNNNKLNKETNKNLCSSNDERDLFDEFWKRYPRKQKKEDARKIWKREKNDKIATLIFNDIDNRVQFEQQWQDKKFIPLPSTYLNGKRWEDAIINVTAPKEAAKLMTNSIQPYNTTKSTVPEWGPGHPTYDSLHGKPNQINRY